MFYYHQDFYENSSQTLLQSHYCQAAKWPWVLRLISLSLSVPIVAWDSRRIKIKENSICTNIIWKGWHSKNICLDANTELDVVLVWFMRLVGRYCNESATVLSEDTVLNISLHKTGNIEMERLNHTELKWRSNVNSMVWIQANKEWSCREGKRCFFSCTATYVLWTT